MATATSIHQHTHSDFFTYQGGTEDCTVYSLEENVTPCVCCVLLLLLGAGVVDQIRGAAAGFGALVDAPLMLLLRGHAPPSCVTIETFDLSQHFYG